MKTTILSVAVLAAALVAVDASAQVWRGDADVIVAGKALGHDDWGSVDHQGELGIQTDFQRGDWPIAIAADLLVSGKTASISSPGFTELRGNTSEFDVGARKIWRPDDHLRPYVGGGLALVSGDLEFRGPAGTVSDHDSGVGLWLGGGVFWTLSRAFNIGLDAKVSHADVRLFGADKSAGGLHLGLLLGYHWGD